MRAVSALLFFPRGGSSHLARSFARVLPEHGWDITLVSGSSDGAGDARRFYTGLDPVVVDFCDPGTPMQPSYEDRQGAPDVVFARVDDAAYERHVDVWSEALVRARAAEADVLHLHHLTPLHEAAARVAPGVPVVGHLHGTELLMLEEIDAGPPAGWEHAEAWADRMRRWALRCERTVVATQSTRERAGTALGIDLERCEVIGSGFDTEAFRPVPVDRAAHWRRELAEAPEGWRPGEGPGSVGYSEALADRVAGSTVVLTAGRFTAVKRTDVLIRAFAAAQPRLSGPASLVIVGGHPGEWEGEHPVTTIESLGLENVFLAGWKEHAELPAFLNAADVFALASVREQFGLVLVEAMACELPPIAVDRFGPREIVEDGRTGWLVEPDDEASLTDALVAAIEDPDERRRRAAAARETALSRYSWTSLGGRLAEVFGEVA